MSIITKRGDDLKKRYLLNANSKTVHDTKNCDGRCKLNLMREEFKIYFDTLDEALSYLKTEKPIVKKCSFCIKK